MSGCEKLIEKDLPFGSERSIYRAPARNCPVGPASFSGCRFANPGTIAQSESARDSQSVLAVPRRRGLELVRRPHLIHSRVPCVRRACDERTQAQMAPFNEQAIGLNPRAVLNSQGLWIAWLYLLCWASRPLGSAGWRRTMPPSPSSCLGVLFTNAGNDWGNAPRPPGTKIRQTD